MVGWDSGVGSETDCLTLCQAPQPCLFKILSKILYRSMEDFKLVDDVQEGFRQFQSTKGQLSKINCILAGQQLCKTSLYVLLCWDVKNASMLRII